MPIPFQTYFALGAVVALIILIQRRVYRATLGRIGRWFPYTTRSGFDRGLILGLFVLFNLPWLLLVGVGMSDQLALWVTLSKVRLAWMRGIMYPFAIWQLSCAATALLLATVDAGRWIRRILDTGRARAIGGAASPAGPDLGRREWVQAAGTSLALLPFAASSYGAFAAREYMVEHPEIHLQRWPSELDGFRMVQLTDIHVGLFMSEERLREIVRAVNDLSPDLIALTGDFVSSSHLFVEPCVRALAGLRAKHGIYACLGNHDQFTDSVSLLAEGFEANKIRLLVNERETLAIGTARVNLIGIDYVRQDGRGYPRMMRGIPMESPTILLSHQPNVFPMAAEQGINLQLSGHTHGGQVKFELLGASISPARLISPYVAGLYQQGASQLYVSRGVGTTGPPVRLNALPEITLLTLRSA